MSELGAATRAYREQLLRDAYRPGYHFCVPDGDGRPGDPNGCFFADGRHHLMYLYRRQDRAFCWGHVSSTDLVHWRHHADALVKGEGDEGCFSGGGFVDDDGTAYLSFWIFNDGSRTQGRNAGIGIAKSVPPYEHWERVGEAVIPSTEWGILDVPDAQGDMQHLGCADPSNIWKRDGVYYMQTGNLCVLNKYGRVPDAPPHLRGDWVELFSSKDMKRWEHEGRFYQRRTDNAWTDESEDDMCPSFLPLPTSAAGGAPSDKHLQLFIAHNKGSQYYIGRYEGMRFYPESHGRMSWVDNSFFAPEAYLDDRGRQIMFAWLLDNLDHDFERFGWSGAFSLPRSLWLGEDGALRMAPVEELCALRYRPQRFDVGVLSGASRPLAVADARSCELRLTIDVSRALRAGIAIGDELFVGYDAQRRALVFDATRSMGTPRAVCEAAPLELAPGEPLELTVYIDQAVIEIFANDRQAICRRAYLRDPEHVDLYACCEGIAEFGTLCAWSMMPSMPY